MDDRRIQIGIKERADIAYEATLKGVRSLENLRGTGPGKATLAELRQGLGKNPEEAPESWGKVLSYIQSVRTEEIDNGFITPEEKAVYLAMCLYALGCQGQDNKSQQIQQEGISLGKAVGKLAKGDSNSQNSLQTKLKSLLGAKSYNTFAVQLRALIPMICKKGGLDFPRLAKDLVYLQYSSSKKNVGIQWIRSFVIEVDRLDSIDSKEVKKEEE